MKLVVVSELLSRRNVAQAEQRHAVGAGNVPLLHLAVGFARVVDEARQTAHAVAVDDEPLLEMQAVVVARLGVILSHALLEFFIRDHLSRVLQQVLTCRNQCMNQDCCTNNHNVQFHSANTFGNGERRAHAVSTVRVASEELFEAGRTVLTLHAVVGTGVSSGTLTRVAFREDHPEKCLT